MRRAYSSKLYLSLVKSQIDLSLSLFLQEHTSYVYGLQFDEFQLISVSIDQTINVHDFLGTVVKSL